MDSLDLPLRAHEDEQTPVRPRRPAALRLDPSLYPGGIAIWGALATVYDTSVRAPEQGVHVHARMTVGGTKSIDETFDVVEVITDRAGTGMKSLRINGDDAFHYNVSTILKRALKCVQCPACGRMHSDKGWHAVHAHRRHECENCGVVFVDTAPGIGNPVMSVKKLCGDMLQDRQVNDPVDRRISVRQERYPGGVQLWGSNPAIVWTSPKLEEGGVHFHGFFNRTETPTADETYGVLEIDGVRLDPEMARHLMAQQALPYLVPSLVALDCPRCRNPHFDSFEWAADPHREHVCEACQAVFTSPEPVVSNPLIRTVRRAYQNFRRLYPAVVLRSRFPWDPF